MRGEAVFPRHGRRPCRKPGCDGTRLQGQALCTECRKSLPDRIKVPLQNVINNGTEEEIETELTVAIVWLQENEKQSPPLL